MHLKNQKSYKYLTSYLDDDISKNLQIKLKNLISEKNSGKTISNILNCVDFGVSYWSKANEITEYGFLGTLTQELVYMLIKNEKDGIQFDINDWVVDSSVDHDLNICISIQPTKSGKYIYKSCQRIMQNEKRKNEGALEESFCRSLKNKIEIDSIVKHIIDNVYKRFINCESWIEFKKYKEDSKTQKTIISGWEIDFFNKSEGEVIDLKFTKREEDDDLWRYLRQVLLYVYLIKKDFSLDCKTVKIVSTRFCREWSIKLEDLFGGESGIKEFMNICDNEIAMQKIDKIFSAVEEIHILKKEGFLPWEILKRVFVPADNKEKEEYSKLINDFWNFNFNEATTKEDVFALYTVFNK